MKLSKADYDAVAEAIHAVLDDNDDAHAEVRRDVEHMPEAVPADVWRDAVLWAVNNAHRQVA